MNKRLSVGSCAVMISLAFASVPALAGTKFQTSLVPTLVGASPGFSNAGSSVKIDINAVKGKIKKVVDGAGALVSTDGTPSADDYTIEIDTLEANATTGMLVIPFDLTNGNGKFSLSLSGVFTPAGQSLSFTGIRVKDSVGTVLGTGGISLE